MLSQMLLSEFDPAWPRLALRMGVSDVSEQLTQVKQAATVARQRAMLVCSGTEAWRVQCAVQLVDAFKVTYGVSVGFPSPLKGCSRLQHSHQLLGVDLDAVLWDVRGGLNPDQLALAAGAVQAGGCLALFVPPLSEWPYFLDPDYRRLLIEGYTLSDIVGHFSARLARVVLADAHVMLWQQGVTLALPDWLARYPVATAALTGEPTEEQRSVIDAVGKAARGHRHRPVVIKADRGRGKTAALGMASAQLLSAGGVDIWVTAPRLDNVEPLFRHALAARPELMRDSANELRAVNGARLRFAAPDALLHETQTRPGAATLLLVDEAAALSPHLLTQYLAQFSRVVFATTVHGYEGSGRGFELRFLPLLQQRFQQIVQLTLTEPVRWAADDPLEALLNKALLLKPCVPLAPDPIAKVAGCESVSGRVVLLSQSQLAGDDALLTRVFHLLLDAHYRTRPTDLRDLLDGPNLRVWVCIVQEQVVGVLLVAEEGGLADELDAAVGCGERRPRGHQLPQTLVAQLGVAGSLTARFARIVRIAVAAEWRRHGIGRLLLSTIETVYQQAGTRAVGSLFGATPTLMTFWQQSGYQPLRLGFTHQTSTGEHSVLVLKNLIAQPWLDPQIERFQLSFRHQLSGVFHNLPAELALILLAAIPETEHERLFGQWMPWMAEEFNAFCRGHRYYDACETAIYQWCLRYLGHLSPACPNAQLLVARVLQQQGIAVICSRFGLAGQRGVDTAVRAALIKVHCNLGDTVSRNK